MYPLPKREVPEPTLSNHPNYVERYWQHRQFLHHKKTVANIQPAIDNKAPPLQWHLHLKLSQIQRDNDEALKVHRQNKQILRNINLINRSKGVVDSHWDKYPTIRSPHNIIREREAYDITKENCRFYNKIKCKPSQYACKIMAAEWKKTSKLLAHASRYLSHRRKILPKDSIPQVPQSRPYRCYFDIQTERCKPLGRLVFEIYADIVPKTAFNFLAICKGLGGFSYRGSCFHRIHPGLMCQGGDITKGNGSGGYSVYGPHFPDENFTLSHGGAGILSMANKGMPDTNNSIFNITFRPLVTLNGVCVVIGRVVEGMDTLFEIQSLGTETGKPKRKVFIIDCGLDYY